MSECLHCAINELVQEHIERGNADLAEVASLIAESLADLVLHAPDGDQTNLLAHAIAAVGQIFLEKSGAFEGQSTATH
jgi:hypothetical protein